MWRIEKTTPLNSKMTDKEIYSITNKRKVHFGFWDWFDQLLPIFFLTFIPAIIGLTPTIYKLISGAQIRVDVTLILVLIFLPLSILGVAKIRRNQKVHMIGEKLDLNDILTAVNELDWEIVEQGPSYLFAKTKFSLLSWGERIRIFVIDEKVYFNSAGTAAFTFGKNRRNRSIFKGKLKELHPTKPIN